ncbi:MAG: hypothetical protein ACYDG6_02050 [Thermincolia bacterium]
MCGITGLLNPPLQTALDAMQTLIKQMADSLIHRGPNDSGTWVDVEAGIALGHRRLSIINLTSEGSSGSGIRLAIANIHENP